MAPKAQTKKILRLIVGVVFVTALILSVRHFSVPECSAIQQQVDDWGTMAPVMFFLAYVVATVAFVPGIVVTMAAGLAFGPLWGTLVVSISSTVGATLAFLIARYVARDAVEGFLSKQTWFEKFRANVQEDGFNYVLFVRLVPLFPFNALNYASGLTPLKLRHYVIGSMIGMLPGTFAYVYLGATGCSLIDLVRVGNYSNIPSDVKMNLIITVGIFAVLSVIPIVIKKVKARRPAPSNG